MDKTNINLSTENIKTSTNVPIPSESVGQAPQPNQADMNGGLIKQMGTTIIESNLPVKGMPTTGKQMAKSGSIRAEKHCNDANFTLHRLENKFTLVKNIDWDISQNIGTILYQASVPNDILVTPAMKTPFDVTALWRMTAVKVRVITKSSPHYGGSLVIGFLPSMNLDYTIEGVSDMTRAIQMGAKIQHASDDQTIEFHIPYRHYLNFIEVPHDALGQIVIWVLNPLRTGASNPNSIQLSVYVALENSEFKIPEYVNPTTYHSHKFLLESIKESGQYKSAASKYLQEQEFEYENKKLEGKATFIDGPEKAASINMNIADAPVTMLCAGAGYVSEPKIKQFADHPVDAVQLRKRFRHVGPLLTTDGTDVWTVGADKTLYIYLDGSALINETAVYLSKIFKLYRGSFLMKIIPYVLEGSQQNVITELFIFNNLISSLIPEEPAIKEQQGYYKGGSHYFSAQEPAEFMVPYMSPNFTAVYDNAFLGDTFSKQQWNLCIRVRNLSLSGDVRISFDRYQAVGDDFATGVFRGIGLDVYQLAPSLKVQSRILPRIIKSTKQSGVLDLIQRAKETTLPIIETIDEISNLLDAHPVTYQRYPITSRKIGYTISTDNIQYVERTNVTNHNGLSLSDKEAFGMEKETDIYKLMREVKTLDRVFQWTTSDKSGKLLSYWNVGPFPVQSSDQLTYQSVAPMDLFSAEATYWNGSIRYCIDVAASQQHKGQLTLSYHPNLSSPPENINLATQQYFMTFDLSQGRSTEYVDVPYLAKYSYRPIYNTLDRPYGETSPFNGIVCLWVQNPLRASSTVSDTVDINIYKAAGPDFNLDVFSAYGNKIV